MSLALLPCQEVEFAFEELVPKAPPLLVNLIDYFRNFWFRQMPLELWNVHNLDIRTNNNAEGKYCTIFTYNIRDFLSISE